MNNGIVLTVNLVGRLGADEIKTEAVKSRNGEVVLIKNISFKGRYPTKCTRKTNISEGVVAGWVGGKSPFFIKEFIWKNMSKPQRLKAWVERFDEGFGVTYQEL